MLALGVARGSKIEDERERLAELREDDGPDVAYLPLYARRRDGPNVLTLRRRAVAQTVEIIGFYWDLGTAGPKASRQRDDMNDPRVACQYSLGRDNNGGTEEPGFAASRHAEVELDDLTRRAV